MDKYISWIDIALYNSFQNESVDCLYEIVVKRMDYTHKMDISNSHYSVNDKLLFAESVCALIEGIGIEVIGCVKDKVSNAQAVLFQCYDLALKYFSHPSLLTKRQNDKVSLENGITHYF